MICISGNIVAVSNAEEEHKLLFMSPGVQSAAGSLDSASVEGQARQYAMTYNARLPYPKSCLQSIDAAFYLYDRKTSPEGDKIVLISYGYTWM